MKSFMDILRSSSALPCPTILRNSATTSSRRTSIAAFVLLLIVCISQLPLFLQSSLTPDTVLYDLQAQCVRDGGVLYRDIVEPNLPGVVWVHLIVRALAGSSDIALRAFDFSIVLAAAVLLTFLSTPAKKQNSDDSVVTSTTFGTAFSPPALLMVSALMLFYLTTSEWCHCQRDTWMLFPGLLAVHIRLRLCRDDSDAGALTHACRGKRLRRIALSFSEGILWATGFWLKPFIAVPALAVILCSALFIRERRSWWIQVCSVLSGGLFIGGVGIFWMMSSGCWVHFVDMLTSWNADYFQAGRSRWTLDRFLSHCTRFYPWIWLHLPALYIAVSGLISAWKISASGVSKPDDAAEGLLGSMYAGWIFQAFALQQLFDYVHVPGMLLAMGVCRFGIRRLRMPDLPRADRRSAAELNPKRLLIPAVIAILIGIFLTTPSLRWSRQKKWLACVQCCIGGTADAELRDATALTPFPRWKELQPMLNEIAVGKLADSSVMAYNGNLVHLYSRLGTQPPTRFVYLDVLARCFPNRRQEMLQELSRSSVKYVLSDLVEDGWELPVDEDQLLPPAIVMRKSEMFFPYNQTAILRSGGYVLFEVSGDPGWLTSEYSPLADLPGVVRTLQKPTAGTF